MNVVSFVLVRLGKVGFVEIRKISVNLRQKKYLFDE